MRECKYAVVYSCVRTDFLNICVYERPKGDMDDIYVRIYHLDKYKMSYRPSVLSNWEGRLKDYSTTLKDAIEKYNLISGAKLDVEEVEGLMALCVLGS